MGNLGSERINIMGNLSKKLLGMGALGAAAGAAAYYFMKAKEENADLQEDFSDFQDHLKETAASAVHVASRLKDAVEKSVDDVVNKAREHSNDFADADIFEDEDAEDSVAEEAPVEKPAEEE